MGCHFHSIFLAGGDELDDQAEHGATTAHSSSQAPE